MKQQLISRLFIILPAVLCAFMISIGNAFAADPVTIRYEVTSFQTSLGFVSCHNEQGPRTELLADGTAAWSYQFTTTNLGQLISVYPVPVDNPDAAILIISKIYINDVLYKTATGQNSASASINDTLGNLLTARPAPQWAVRYEVTAEQTTLGFLTYSNNHTLGQSEILAAGTTAWAYQYTTTDADQPVKIEAVPVVPNDPNKFYAVVIKVFVNDNMLYYATFSPNTQPAIVDINLADLLAIGQPPVQKTEASNEYSNVQIITGIEPNQIQVVEAPPLKSYNTGQAVVFDPRQMFRGPNQIHTAGFSFFTDNSYFYLTLVTGPQPLDAPELEESPGFLLASVPSAQ